MCGAKPSGFWFRGAVWCAWWVTSASRAGEQRTAYGRSLALGNQRGLPQIGFDNLNPIIWHKISNASYEVSNGSKFLGKPYEPNAIIKNDIEYILMQRKPGGYRKPTEEQRRLSMISKDKFDKWFQQFWNLTGASTKEHPAPFPLELASRLVQMFSFVGDTVVDPFCGTATTMVAALKHGRNSVGVELDTAYCKQAASRLMNENTSVRKCEITNRVQAAGCACGRGGSFKRNEQGIPHTQAQEN